jgi:hypothetical protein
MGYEAYCNREPQIRNTGEKIGAEHLRKLET